MKKTAYSVLKYSLVGLALASFTSIAQSPLDIRVALVIGNAAYKHVPALSNPGNDANSMAFALGRLGFKVFKVVDGDKAAMIRAIGQMQTHLKGQQAIGMLYYAGHGLQLDWRNYMVPVDALLNEAEDVPQKTVDVEQVIRVFKESGTRMNILVLDACRDNPFEQKAGSGKGLAQMDAPAGTYLAFATAPGNVAEDGDDVSGNGLYTQFLLKELQRPASIESVFKRVRLQVRQKSEGRQIPWDSTSLEEDFSFNDGKKYTFTLDDYRREIQAAKDKEERLKREAELVAARQRLLAQQQEVERQRLAEAQKIQEERARQKAQAESAERERKLAQALEEEQKKALAAAQALERARAEEARRLKDIEMAKVQAEQDDRRKKMSVEASLQLQFEQEKQEWDKIKESKNARDFYDFLLKYPTGLISQQATFSLEQLDKAKIQTQPNKNGEVQKIGESLFRAGDRWTQLIRDAKTGKVIRRDENVVTKIENGMAYFSSQEANGIMTMQGAAVQAIASEGSYFYDPPLPVRPGGEMMVGMKWTSSTMQANLRTGKKGLRTEEFRVLAYEKITVPAGTFWTYKIESKATTMLGHQATNIKWFSVDLGVPIKRLRQINLARSGATIREESQELESFVAGK